MTDNPLIQSAPLAETAKKLQSGDLSLHDLLDIIEARFNESEPQIEAFIPEENRFERLRQEAHALEATYPTPESRPPLYGLLAGIKDIFHVDGFITRAGTALPSELFVGAEAAVVRKLKQAGALIIGKTVTTEFAYFEPGPTRNPHNLENTPGGSSSGSAASVAAGLAHLATGTQTVGSVIRPAAYCGIVGYKPSFDRIDTAGLLYFSRSVDHVGLFTQDIAGMRLLASVLVNDWQSDKRISTKPILGIPDGAYLQQASALDEFYVQVKKLEDAGYTIKHVPTSKDIIPLNELHTDMISAELAIEHAEWFANYEALYRPRTANLIREGKNVSEERLQDGRQNRLILRTQLQIAMDNHDLDAWICPAAPDVAPEGISATGSPAMNLLWTHAGVPAVTIPAGKGQLDLPLGLQICGAFGDDERLLAWAEEIADVFN